MRRTSVVLLIASLASACEAWTAHAQCLDPLWQIDAGGPVTARAACDSRFGLGLSLVAAGQSLVAVSNESGQAPVPHTGGQVFWAVPFGNTIENYPNPVKLKGGGEAVFIAVAGAVYRIGAASGAIE